MVCRRGQMEQVWSAGPRLPDFKIQTSNSKLRDGMLRSWYGKTLQAAIEVKKAVGECNDNATTKQEVSQIIGMIKEGATLPFSVCVDYNLSGLAVANIPSAGLS